VPAATLVWQADQAHASLARQDGQSDPLGINDGYGL